MFGGFCRNDLVVSWFLPKKVSPVMKTAITTLSVTRIRAPNSNWVNWGKTGASLALGSNLQDLPEQINVSKSCFLPRKKKCWHFFESHISSPGRAECVAQEAFPSTDPWEDDSLAFRAGWFRVWMLFWVHTGQLHKCCFCT